jgi:cyclopropane fatty-acyl-phospholipid synthase-like methyltransferase
MAQITSGFHAIFSSPAIYDLAQAAVGAERCRARLVRDYLGLREGMRMLDIGCGTAAILGHIPAGVAYVGVDLSERYIAAARRKFGARGSFHCVDIARADPGSFDGFDVVHADGLLHHLDDEHVTTMLRVARSALKTDGRLVTIDPCFDDRQSPLARFTIRHDRGQNVRTAEGYSRLAKEVFGGDVGTQTRFDMFYIPYTHAIIEARR